jgi:hypothetical protein
MACAQLARRLRAAEAGLPLGLTACVEYLSDFT